MDKYFTEEEINNIIYTDKVDNYTRNTLDVKVDDIFEYFIDKKMSIQDIKSMIMDYPRLLTLSLKLITERYDNVFKIFKNNTNRLLISNSRILSRSIESFNNRIQYFSNLGLDKKSIIKACLDCSTIVTVGELNLDISIKNLSDKIENKKDLIDLIKNNASVLSFSNKRINEKFDWFYKKGYNKEQTSLIVCKAETILSMKVSNNDVKKDNDSNIEIKYNYLFKTLKYTKEEIINITCKFPEYYTLKLDTIKKRIDNLLNLGFSYGNIKLMIFNYPKIISFRIDTLNEKYEYYSSLDMLNIFIKSPNYLMQSLELTDARYNYLINKVLIVNKNNYGKLFVSSNRFKENYGIDNNELLKKYRENGGYYGKGTNKENTRKFRTRNK